MEKKHFAWKKIYSTFGLSSDFLSRASNISFILAMISASFSNRAHLNCNWVWSIQLLEFQTYSKHKCTGDIELGLMPVVTTMGWEEAGRLVVKDAGAAPALWQVRARQGQEREQTCPRTQRLVITQSPRPAQNQLCHSLSIEAWRFCSFQHPEKHKTSSWSMNIVCLADNVIVNEFALGHKDNGWGYH